MTQPAPDLPLYDVTARKAHQWAMVGLVGLAFVLADAFLEKFGGDSIEEIERHYEATAEQVRRRFAAR